MNGEPSSDERKVSEEVNFSNVSVRDPMVDTTLDGRFVIEEVLGSGGMSVIYKARQLRVNRHVAIKTLRMQTEAKPIYKERFEREISSLCSLNHPNIVTLYDCIVGPDDQPYVVMDYLRGRSLEALIKSEGPLVVGRFASIAMQICSALDHAHKKGVVHRDLKPGNIVLIDDETDFVKVVDFGLAKLSVDNRNLTQSGELWGSPPYMSPEQCMGESGDERSDIYSLGAVMYEMIVGKDPFRDAHSVFDFIQRHIHASPPPFFQANPNINVSIELESVIFKALEKSPLDRFQTAQELQDAIVQACGEDSGKLIYHPSRAGRTTNGTGIEVGATKNEPVDQPKPQSYERSDKSQQVAWFAGMLGAGNLSESMALGNPESTVRESSSEVASSRDVLLQAPDSVAPDIHTGQSLTAQESAASLRLEEEQIFAETNGGHRLVRRETIPSTPIPAEVISAEPIKAETPQIEPTISVHLKQETKAQELVPQSPNVATPAFRSEETDPATSNGLATNSNVTTWTFAILVIALLGALFCMTVCMFQTPRPSTVTERKEEVPFRKHRRPQIQPTSTDDASAPGEQTNQTTDIELE